MPLPKEQKQTGVQQGAWSIEIWKRCDHCEGTGLEHDKFELTDSDVINTARRTCHYCRGNGRTREREVTLPYLDLKEADALLREFSVAK